jgi:heat shock protein HtpX
MEKQGHISFYDQISRNKRKSFMLIVIVFLIFLGLGYVISKATNPGNFFFIMILAIIISILYVVIGYYNSDKIALASVAAIPASREEYRQYYHSVEGLTLASGMPMPKLYIMKNSQINAFATGRDPQRAVICVTTGALEKLSKQELEGVLAHELSHIASYDIRFMTLVAVLVGMIAIISEIFLRSLWFRSSNRDNKGSAIFMIIGIALAILAPIFVQLVQLAISRKREYAADATAVKFTRYPPGLINALKKISNDAPMKNKSSSKVASSLFISAPDRKDKDSLFSTHPAISNRVNALERM